ncbi:hypothetical protein RJ641_007152 [Dillenia turbinata]|uniref:Uncharacterized protein n=1 Tax=Dillenia turbinata TaxID=194707 RepID=A0AAN8Z879_9MAGN
MFPILFLLLSTLFTPSFSTHNAHPKIINPQITVMGVVYCDICSNNTFTRHSYFIPGVEVEINCKFKAVSPRTVEQIEFSANRTTNRFGMYKLEIPSVDGIQCATESALESSCQASLMWTSSSSCNVPGYRTTTNEIAIKSERDNVCFYSLSALNYRPNQINKALCGN